MNFDPKPDSQPLPPRLLLGFVDAEFEQQFVAFYTDFYYRFAQASLALGLLLVVGDFLVDHWAYPGVAANTYRLTLCAPILIAALAYSLLAHARRYWEPVMSAFIVVVAGCMLWILLELDAQGGQGLHSWVGILNFAILQLYCFVILGTRFNHSLVSGLLIFAGFEYAMQAGLNGTADEVAYFTYHTATMTLIAGTIGWWREYLLRKNFATEAMVTHSAMRHATERSLLGATLEATNSGILVVSLEGKITSSNRRFAEMWGIPAEVLADGSDDVVLAFVLEQLNDPQYFLQTVRKLYSQPETKSKDQLLFTDGRVFERTSFPQVVNQQIVGRVWSFLDITDRVRAEGRVYQLTRTLTDELANSERQRGQLQALLGAIPEMVWMKDPQGVFLSCNAAFERLIGASASDIIGKTDHDFSAPDIAQAFDANDRAATASAQPIVYEEWVDYRSEDRLVLLETTKLAVRDAQQTLIGVLGVARDITASRVLLTELENAKDEAQKSNRAKSLFLANMSHEIRTPMNAIIGMADLALNTTLDARQRNYVNKIRIASDGLMQIINDILDFSKIEAEKMQIEAIPFELDDIFEQLGSLMALRAQGQGMELVFHTATRIPQTLMGDALRLGQVLTNLVSNALKFSSRGSVVVRVESQAVEADRSELHFSVQDEGIGLTAEQSAQMFQPFIQADTSTTRRFGGTGLGLAICRHLVGLFGGRIWVESSYGVGSTFHFTASFSHGADKPLHGFAPLADALAQSPPRSVLLVDHNPAARHALRDMVEALGFTTVSVEQGELALGLMQGAEAPKFAACLVSWQLPGIDGLQTIAALRAACTQRGMTAPPMLLLAPPGHLEKAPEVLLQVDGALAKPVCTGTLYDELARCLGYTDMIRPRSALRKSSDQHWGRFQGLDILLAEDMDINQEVIGELLKAIGLSIRVVNNGVEALDAVSHKAPDLILMDCHMPQMDGYEATRQLRSNPAYDQVMVIALTASAMADDKQRCLASGMNGYVPKPVHMDDLYEQMCLCLPSFEADPLPNANPAFVMERPLNPSLPVLPGIDARLGLAQVGGRPELYLRLLKKFRDNLGSQFEPQFVASIALKDWQTAFRLAHSLKGLSTTLGATELAQHALALESALKGQTTQGLEEPSARVMQALRSLLNGLKNLPEPVQNAEPTQATRALTTDEMEQLQALHVLLESRDVAALELVHALTQSMADTPHAKPLKAIAEAIDRYAFEAAAIALQPWLPALQGHTARPL